MNIKAYIPKKNISFNLESIDRENNISQSKHTDFLNKYFDFNNGVDCWYNEIDALNGEINFTFNDKTLNIYRNINYVCLDINSIKHYYFVSNNTIISTDVIRCNIRLDTITTFFKDLSFIGKKSVYVIEGHVKQHSNIEKTIGLFEQEDLSVKYKLENIHKIEQEIPDVKTHISSLTADNIKYTDRHNKYGDGYAYGILKGGSNSSKYYATCVENIDKKFLNSFSSIPLIPIAHKPSIFKDLLKLGNKETAQLPNEKEYDVPIVKSVINVPFVEVKLEKVKLRGKYYEISRVVRKSVPSVQSTIDLIKRTKYIESDIVKLSELSKDKAYFIIICNLTESYHITTGALERTSINKKWLYGLQKTNYIKDILSSGNRDDLQAIIWSPFLLEFNEAVKPVKDSMVTYNSSDVKSENYDINTKIDFISSDDNYDNEKINDIKFHTVINKIILENGFGKIFEGKVFDFDMRNIEIRKHIVPSGIKHIYKLNSKRFKESGYDEYVEQNVSITLPLTADRYGTYQQENSNRNSAIRGISMASIIGSTIGILATVGKGNIGGGIGGIMTGATNLAQVDAQIKDAKNSLGTTSNASENSSGVYEAVKDNALISFNILKPIISDIKKINDKFYLFGYKINSFVKFKNVDDFNIKKVCNFFNIDNLASIIKKDNLMTDYINDISNLFQRGVRFWNTEIGDMTLTNKDKSGNSRSNIRLTLREENYEL